MKLDPTTHDSKIKRTKNTEKLVSLHYDSEKNNNVVCKNYVKLTNWHYKYLIFLSVFISKNMMCINTVKVYKNSIKKIDTNFRRQQKRLIFCLFQKTSTRKF